MGRLTYSFSQTVSGWLSPSVADLGGNPAMPPSSLAIYELCPLLQRRNKREILRNILNWSSSRMSGSASAIHDLIGLHVTLIKSHTSRLTDYGHIVGQLLCFLHYVIQRNS